MKVTVFLHNNYDITTTYSWWNGPVPMKGSTIEIDGKDYLVDSVVFKATRIAPKEIRPVHVEVSAREC